MVSTLAGNELDLRDGHHDGGSAADLIATQFAAATIISGRTRPVDYQGPLTFDGLLHAAGVAAAALLDEHAYQVDQVAQLLTERHHATTGWRHVTEHDLPTRDATPDHPRG